MKRLVKMAAVVLALTVMAPAVLSAQAQGKPPTDPGGVCALIYDLPLPDPVLVVLATFFGCPDCPPNCAGGF